MHLSASRAGDDPARREGEGFTLTELLTVIAIIGVFAGVLIPVIGRARSSARDSQCLAQVRTLALAHGLYRADFEGDSPPGTANNDHPLSEGHNVYGISLLRRYYKPGPYFLFSKSPTTFIVDKTEKCPNYEVTGGVEMPDRRGPDYGMLTRDEKYDLFYAQPSRTPLIWDGWNAIWNSARRFPLRHGGRSGVNVAFLDSHVEYIPQTDGRLYVSWWAAATTQTMPNQALLGQGAPLGTLEQP